MNNDNTMYKDIAMNKNNTVNKDVDTYFNKVNKWLPHKCWQLLSSISVLT